jgi:hypothetical protein
MICYICENQQDVERKTYSAKFLAVAREFNGPEIEVDGLEGWYCPSCDDYVMDPEQIKHNFRLLELARVKYSGK